MIELTDDEFKNWRCQFGTSNSEKMGLRYKPMAFSEQGIAMLASVLKSKKAIAINIQIVKIFVRLRQMIQENESLSQRMSSVENKLETHEKAIIKIIQEMGQKELQPRKKIGFKI